MLLRRLIVGSAVLLLGSLVWIAFVAGALTPYQRSVVKDQPSIFLRETIRQISPTLLAEYEFTRGYREAQRDIDDGQPSLRVTGLRSLGFDTYLQEELSRYGVALDTTAGCVVEMDALRRTRGYNTAISVELKARFKVDVLEVAQSEAAKRFEQDVWGNTSDDRKIDT